MARKSSSRWPAKKITKKKKEKPTGRRKPARKKPPKKATTAIGALVTREVPVAGAFVGEPSSMRITAGTIPPPPTS